MTGLLLRKPQLCQRLGNIGGSTAYDWSSKGLLTSPVKIGPRASAWPSHEIDAIADARVAGCSNAEIRALVDRLHAARKATA